ncbi:MoaD/ThiS family protein [Polaribacter sp. HL-MS24]|uniref:MoaD/ThiS family protein n=1 Tax=Polaribacter sp. HL-MS24 TaxID=3077735 RepID=UPI002934FB31|nr:MoaD/ThiS family protein [Polaribacter sp. HL-MS24]WOC40977.1 MoaD/ThiS family protein [Polaribacter sp. HL-MS24]
MKINLLLFGITADLIGKNTLDFEVSENTTVEALKTALLSKFVQLQNLKSYAIAVNEKYASDEVKLQANDVVAIIPPVSGG